MITSTIHNRIDESDAKIDALAIEIGQVTAIKENQERHERLLEKLALRSIEQESWIEKFEKIKP